MFVVSDTAVVSSVLDALDVLDVSDLSGELDLSDEVSVLDTLDLSGGLCVLDTLGAPAVLPGSAALCGRRACKNLTTDSSSLGEMLPAYAGIFTPPFTILIVS